ncbi:hypothetical protein HUO13_23275 [Saccharopolyspora erythraea]|uniref:hypothetical protein n=1 Tax=Saccharopolyspora erythraea TaxID=1836 RepID=UPI001BA7D121|nr:hypothetical protein [Saccharopolyspora erythraea]QUH03357.1 hypothetical protein HUO13_23275 [Saccharopolyspora erythraea]
MSRSELASEVSAWLYRETGKRFDLDPHLVAKWERGAVRLPTAAYRSALRAVLGANSDADLGFSDAPTATETAEPSPTGVPETPGGGYFQNSQGPWVGVEYVDSLRSAVGQFVKLEALLGGGDIVASVIRRFRDAQRVLGEGRYLPQVERDLEAAAAELGELAGWMLHDAERHDEARQINAEALMLARVAGDLKMEWFILSNQALSSTHAGRDREALRISDRMIETDPPARVRALFDVRRARALGHLGDGAAALKAFDRAKATFAEGVTSRDPEWSWWFGEEVVNAHTGLLHVSLGEHGRALPYLAAAAEGASKATNYQWGILIHRANLLDGLLRAGDSAEAERVALATVPLVGQVNSGGAEGVLRRAATREAGKPWPSTLSDVLEHMWRRPAPCG